MADEKPFDEVKLSEAFNAWGDKINEKLDRLEREVQDLRSQLSIAPSHEPTEESTDQGPEINIAEVFNATAGVSLQVLKLYIPNKDINGVEIGNQRKWILEAANLLAKIGGGVTIMPPVEGGWLNPANNIIIWEGPVIVYTFIREQEFEARLLELRDLLHRMGKETNQGEIAFEFGDKLYRIQDFIFAGEQGVKRI